MNEYVKISKIKQSYLQRFQTEILIAKLKRNQKGKIQSRTIAKSSEN
jgi:hypothetical protein